MKSWGSNVSTIKCGLLTHAQYVSCSAGGPLLRFQTLFSSPLHLSKKQSSLSTACSSSQWRCNSGQCISSYQRCNVLWECTDGSDELNCSECCVLGMLESSPVHTCFCCETLVGIGLLQFSMEMQQCKVCFIHGLEQWNGPRNALWNFCMHMAFDSYHFQEDTLNAAPM